jgi:hypothetical protein
MTASCPQSSHYSVTSILSDTSLDDKINPWNFAANSHFKSHRMHVKTRGSQVASIQQSFFEDKARQESAILMYALMIRAFVSNLLAGFYQTIGRVYGDDAVLDRNEDTIMGELDDGTDNTGSGENAEERPTKRRKGTDGNAVELAVSHDNSVREGLDASQLAQIEESYIEDTERNQLRGVQIVGETNGDATLRFVDSTDNDWLGASRNLDRCKVDQRDMLYRTQRSATSTQNNGYEKHACNVVVSPVGMTERDSCDRNPIVYNNNVDDLEPLDDLDPLDDLEPLNDLVPLDHLEQLDGLEDIEGINDLHDVYDVAANDETHYGDIERDLDDDDGQPPTIALGQVGSESYVKNSRACNDSSNNIRWLGSKHASDSDRQVNICGSAIRDVNSSIRKVINFDSTDGESESWEDAADESSTSAESLFESTTLQSGMWKDLLSGFVDDFEDLDADLQMCLVARLHQIGARTTARDLWASLDLGDGLRVETALARSKSLCPLGSDNVCSAIQFFSGVITTSSSDDDDDDEESKNEAVQSPNTSADLDDSRKDMSSSRTKFAILPR